MLFISKAVRESDFGQILDPLDTKDYTFMASGKFTIFQLSATIL